MTAHAVRSVYVRDDALPEPEAYVADIVCSCFVILTSAVRSSENEALDDVRSQHREHAATGPDT